MHQDSAGIVDSPPAVHQQHRGIPFKQRRHRRLDLKHIHPRVVNDKIVKLAEHGVDLASVSNTFRAHLFEAGVFAQAIAFPTVPRGTARLRLMVSATHTREDLEFVLQTLAEVGRACQIISGAAEMS